MSPGEQADGLKLWEDLTAQRDKLSARASWLAEHEDEPGFEVRAARVSASRERFEALLESAAAWAGVGVGDVAGLLQEEEEKI